MNARSTPPFPENSEDRRQKAQFQTGAFTLIEALTAIAILSFIVVALAQMAGFATSSWSRMVGQTFQRNTSRAIADYFRRDLSAALSPLASGPEGLQLLLNPAVSANVKFPSALFWQAPVATDTTYGDVAVVGYFVRWDESSHASFPRARLCRLLINPAPTGASSNYRIYSDPDGWISDDILDAEAPGVKTSESISDPGNYKGLFAEDVVGMWVTLFDSSGSVVARSGDFYDSRSNGFPAVAEVSFAMLDSRSVPKVTPAIQSTIEQLARSSENAADFVGQAVADDSLRAVSGGIRTANTALYFDTAR